MNLHLLTAVLVGLLLTCSTCGKAENTGDSAKSGDPGALGPPDRHDPNIEQPPSGVPSGDLPPTAVKGSAPSGPAQPSPEMSAADAARRVSNIVGVFVAHDVKIIGARKTEGLFEIKWRPGAKQKAENVTWLTADGEVLSHGRIDLQRRLEELRKLSSFVECLRNWKLTIAVDNDDPISRKQLAPFEPFADRLQVDCTGKLQKLCKDRGLVAFPTHSWRGGSEIGQRDPKWFTEHFQCPLPVVPKGPPPPALTAQDAAEKVRQLYEVATGRPAEIGAVRATPDAIFVTVIQAGDDPIIRNEVLSGDGRFMFPDPFVLARDTAGLNRDGVRMGCLRDLGAKIYLHGGDARSLRLLQALGPLGSMIAVDCREKSNATSCAQAKLRGFPTAVVGERRLEVNFGLRELQAMTGCK